MTLDIRRAADRFRTVDPGRETWHAFSFGPHYDPANTGLGPLVLHDEHRLAADAGFAPHPHAEVEVVTWVLRGALRHEDSTGRSGVVRPGSVQVMSAGTGVVHEERADGVPTDVVQAWVLPDGPPGPPSYAQADVGEALSRGGLVAVASGRPEDGAPLALRHAGTALHAARLAAGDAVVLAAGPRWHVFTARGEVDADGTRLAAGDAVRVTGAALRLTAAEDAELLVWELPAD